MHNGDYKPVVSGNKIEAAKLERAKSFRRTPTIKEAEVWEWLRNRRMEGLKFRRQQIISGYIADFYCAEHRLVLEIDGDSHGTAEGRAADEARDAVLRARGIQTLRVAVGLYRYDYIRELILKAVGLRQGAP